MIFNESPLRKPSFLNFQIGYLVVGTGAAIGGALTILLQQLALVIAYGFQASVFSILVSGLIPIHVSSLGGLSVLLLSFALGSWGGFLALKKNENAATNVMIVITGALVFISGVDLHLDGYLVLRLGGILR